MKKLLLFLNLFLLFSINVIFSQTGTFDFETATTTGTPTSVIQTVSTVTVTVSCTVDMHALDPLTEWEMTVIGITGKTALTDIDMATNFVIAFDAPVNISTLKVFEGTQSNSEGTMIFTPVGGSNSVVNYTPEPNQWDNYAKQVNLNWVGITAINITAPYNYYWGFDDIVMDASLPVELTSFMAKPNGHDIDLSWQTESETDNLGFILERAIRNNDWRQIASYQTCNELKGHNNSSTTNKYRFTDNTVSTGTEYRYRLGDVNTAGVVTMHSPISVTTTALPQSTEMLNAYPNPFNPETMIKYQLHQDSPVTITVYDLLGRNIITLLDKQQAAGSYHVVWNGADANGAKVASGAYIVRMETENKIQLQKVMLIK